MKTTVNTIVSKPKSAFTQLVERLYAEKHQSIGNQGTLASIIGTCFASMSHVQNSWKREAFRDLLLHFETQGCYTVLRDEVYITVLANVAAFGNKMVREIKAWEKDSFVAENQISSLIKHCFAKYEVPEFMESVFYGENKIQMLWYVQLGRGKSVLTLSGFPVKFTNKMAHEFKNAPSNYSISQAIRWAQAKGFNASVIMAETLAWSSLSENFENEEFWRTIVAFFAKHEELPFTKVQEVLFYIKHQYEANKTYNMKGRIWNSLVRHSDEWHVEYYRKLNAENRAEWETSYIKCFKKSVLENEKITKYSIVELINSEDLYEEGYEMSHCIAEYEYECIEGRAAIFSLRKVNDVESIILATIEIDLSSKTIVQAKAKYNEDISLEAENIIFEWAKKENLKLDYNEYYAPENAQHFPDEAFAERAVQYNAPQNNNLAQRINADRNINWKWIAYAAFLLMKACAAMAVR